MFKKASEADKKVIREIAKKHGVKGCAQPLHAVIVGKQGAFISLEVANAFSSELEANGFYVEPNNYALIDTVMVWKAA